MRYEDTPLTTLDNVIAQIKAKGKADSTNDDLINILIGSASALISQYTVRVFAPFRETKLFDARGENVCGSKLTIADADLLEITTLTNGDGTVITSDQYVLRSGGFPKWQIELLPSSSVAWVYDTDWQDAISIDGVWGYHETYNTAWTDSKDTVQDDPLTAAATTVTVVDADGTDARGRLRFSPGNLLKVEDEYMRVLEVNTSSNTLTVTRGANGTTAASHIKTTPIYTYAPMANIEQACATLTVFMERNSASPGEQVQVLLNNTQIKSGEVPKHIRMVLDAYFRLRV